MSDWMGVSRGREEITYVRTYAKMNRFQWSSDLNVIRIRI